MRRNARELTTSFKSMHSSIRNGPRPNAFGLSHAVSVLTLYVGMAPTRP